MFRFEKLEVWKDAIAYASLVYRVTKSFPDTEKFGLTSQMRRSAVSLSANIAEGTSRTTDKDFSRFIEIASGSLMENVSEAFIAREAGFISAPHYTELSTHAEKLAKMLSGLRSSLVR